MSLTLLHGSVLDYGSPLLYVITKTSNSVWQLKPGLEELLLCVSPKSPFSLYFQLYSSDVEINPSSPLSISPLLSSSIYLLLYLYCFNMVHCIHSHFLCLFATEVIESGKWDFVWFHEKKEMVYFQPTFTSSPLLRSYIIMKAPKAENIKAANRLHHFHPQSCCQHLHVSSDSPRRKIWTFVGDIRGY